MNLDFEKQGGLIPALIQDSQTLQVLMLGYMNKEALEKTKKEGKVTFYSRSKQRLWTKGETSKNYLWVDQIYEDCDRDTLLITCKPDGPTCHRGTTSCFDNDQIQGFLYQLEKIVADRIDNDKTDSYTNTLYRDGINRVAQKVGEEAVEVVIEAKDDNDKRFKNEAADLLYHLLILLKTKEFQLRDIEEILFNRHQNSHNQQEDE